MTTGSALGTYLRQQRKAAGLSVRQAARLIGTSHVFLSSVELGKKGLSVERAICLAKVLPGLDHETVYKLAVRDAMQRRGITPEIAQKLIVAITLAIAESGPIGPNAMQEIDGSTATSTEHRHG